MDEPGKIVCPAYVRLTKLNQIRDLGKNAQLSSSPTTPLP